MIVFMYFPVKHKRSFPFLKECHSTQLFSFCFCATTFSNLCFTWINSNDLFSNAISFKLVQQIDLGFKYSSNTS